ncbi:MAG: histone H1-like repetitive region-containing protein [Actinomycetota bacterium]|nr:histone H1-like repetitive region-containing protein [Actinomycetota bacterium]
MTGRHVVVDGSNIATEGRSLPSLAQLDEAVREYKREYPDDVVTVVVDATFGHRIEEPERAPFDEAVAHNELVSPPAGAIGRGDAFLLRIAEKVGATVLSNDSFQEFHGEHDWLFNNGRLIGGKPVPDVGWVFTARTPVRGPKSREAVRTAKKAATRTPAQERKVRKAIAVATEEVVEPDSPSVKRRRRRTASPPAEPVNEPLAFIQFVAEHPLGSEVEGEVDTFSSHGTFVNAGGARCYVPLSGLGDPPPRAAREVVKKGEHRAFVVQALDPARRGIELALPGLARVSGTPTAETVEEEIKGSARADEAPRRARARKATVAQPVEGEPVHKVATKKVPAAKVSAKKVAAKKEPVKKETVTKAAKKEPARKEPAKKVAATKTLAKKAAAKKAAAKKVPAKRAPSKKVPAEKTTAEKTTVTKAVARKAPARKVLARKAPAAEPVPDA